MGDYFGNRGFSLESEYKYTWLKAMAQKAWLNQCEFGKRSVERGQMVGSPLLSIWVANLACGTMPPAPEQLMERRARSARHADLAAWSPLSPATSLVASSCNVVVRAACFVGVVLVRMSGWSRAVSGTAAHLTCIHICRSGAGVRRMAKA
jgi:hypothetical protein